VLTDAALKNLRPKARAYKSTDRGGMYVYVSTGGAISFRYDYRFNGRRETLTLGRYDRAGLTLAQAREWLIEVKKAIADGVSPAVEKQRAKRRRKEARDFAQVAQGWMDRAPMADSTPDMRRAIFNQDILPKWKNRLLSEITPDDLRAPCKGIVDRGAPATAIHVRDIVKQIYGWAGSTMRATGLPAVLAWSVGARRTPSQDPIRRSMPKGSVEPTMAFSWARFAARRSNAARRSALSAVPGPAAAKRSLISARILLRAS